MEGEKAVTMPLNSREKMTKSRLSEKPVFTKIERLFFKNALCPNL